MTTAIVGIFLVLHGLITTMIGAVAATTPNAPALTLPAWFNWWPGPFGRSWLVEALHLGTPAAVLGGLLWLAAGLALIAAGIGFLGFGPLRDYWPVLGLFGGALGLVVVALYFHPLYAAAVVINAALIVLLWGRVTAAS